MNKAQAKKADDISGQLGNIQQDVQELLDEIRDDFDNKSERWQEGEKGQAIETSINELENAIENIEGAIQSLNSTVTE
jgi:molecular chaperone GrpE (heat shock protein)